MRIAAILCGIFTFTYIGYAVGLAAYCNQVPTLQRAKKCAYVIPLYIIIFPFALIYMKKRAKTEMTLWEYFRMPQKGLVFAIAFEELLSREQGRAYNYQQKTKQVILPKPNTFFDMLIPDMRKSTYPYSY